MKPKPTQSKRRKLAKAIVDRAFDGLILGRVLHQEEIICIVQRIEQLLKEHGI